MQNGDSRPSSLPFAEHEDGWDWIFLLMNGWAGGEERRAQDGDGVGGNTYR